MAITAKLVLVRFWFWSFCCAGAGTGEGGMTPVGARGSLELGWILGRGGMTGGLGRNVAGWPETGKVSDVRGKPNGAERSRA